MSFFAISSASTISKIAGQAACGCGEAIPEELCVASKFGQIFANNRVSTSNLVVRLLDGRSDERVHLMHKCAYPHDPHQKDGEKS